MVHGFLDGIVHIDSTKGVEENASNIVTGSAREGFIGLMYGAGFEFAAICVGNTSLPALAKLFIMGANGGATAGTTSRYLSGDEVTAETIAGDAVMGGISTLVLNELARAIQWKMTAGSELPEGYIRDRANSVAKLNASKQCEGKSEPNGVGNSVRVEGRGNTGRTTPNTLLEQMAMNQVRSNPLEGATKVPLTMSDKRWPASEGWVKMQSVVENADGTKTIIHFVYNEITGAFDDFKFK